MKIHTIIFGLLALSVLLSSQHVNAQLLSPIIDARDDAAQTNEDRSVLVDVMANDHFVLVSPSLSSVTQPSDGQARIEGDRIRYTPDTDYFGSDSFRYTVSNGILSDSATVFITVNPVNDIPSATADFAATNEDTSVIINVLSNDSDVDGDPLAISSVTQAGNGVAVVISGNRIMYTPNPNFNGADSFAYTVTDGRGGTSSATVSVTINPVNDPPVAKDDFAVTDEDEEVVIDALSNDADVDGDTLSITSTGIPTHGTAAINSDGTITYAPNSNFNGADEFLYTVSDGIGSTSATISITINQINDSPMAGDDFAATDEDVPALINVLENDSDADNDQLMIIAVTQPVNGTAIILESGIQYEPSRDFNGQDSFSYTVSDSNGEQDTATVSVTVNPIDDFTIIKTQSGLVARDPLNNETQSRQELEAEQGFWHYGGSAFTYFNPPAPTDLFKNSQGLHVGVNPPVNGTYAGYYAVTGPINTKLFHAVITTPVRTISGDFFQNGLYVQTWDGRINYVTCVSITSTAGTSWHIIRTFGNETQATQFEVLWSDLSANQPLTRDCTIITNGVNYLKIYLDGIKVYENSNIDLQMPGPFLYFLEPQNSHAQMLYGIYHDFYTTTDETIKVTNVPDIASRIDLVGQAGNVLAVAPISNGTAVLDVGMYHFPLTASIKMYDAADEEIASVNADIFGGDQYAITQ
ncbi:Ig-like domain-containing protein [Candidatus Nitrosotenuis cloacae]|uniref:Ig-like domain-containing protein n=1 Tax=Candidatus Nitrosotenuis cloacae TaxID=1603555 RepID=UPI0022803566|nr:Ig-like domain-containing protein [Candidatus Nitrosotenuis cloacae]